MYEDTATILARLVAWIDHRVHNDPDVIDGSVFEEREAIRDHIWKIYRGLDNPPELTVKAEQPQMTRPERLDKYWSWHGLQDGMREIDLLRQDLEDRGVSSGIQIVGTTIVNAFIGELEQAFYDAAEIAAAKRRNNR